MQGIDSLLTTSELDEMTKRRDADGDGNISYEEFVAMVPAVMSSVSASADQSLWSVVNPVGPDSGVECGKLIVDRRMLG